MKLARNFGALALGLTMVCSAVQAATTIRVQSVIPAKADEVHMLNEFAKDVSDLTNGEGRGHY